MSSLDYRTKNILVAIENMLTKSKLHNDPITHESIVEAILNATIAVKEAYDKYNKGDMGTTQYSKVLLKLAEITLMAVRRLPG